MSVCAVRLALSIEWPGVQHKHAGAFAYDLYKSRDQLNLDQAGLIGIGFVVAFASGMIVVKTMLDFIAKRGLTPFGIWRIAVGLIGLALLTWA